MGINPIQAAEFQQQIRCRFRADTGNTRDVVRGISHQCLQINQFFRLKTVLFPEFFLCIQRSGGIAWFGDDQLYMNMFINQLQGIPVSGNNDALPPLLGANFSHCSDHVVSFPALTFVDGDIHRPQYVLHDGHLHGQLFRHAMAVCLIAVILFMPERGAMEVKGHANGLGLLFLIHPFQNIEEAVNGVGIQAVPGGQRLDAKVRPVNYAVAV